MDQISNAQLKEFFSGLVANPIEVDAEHTPQLKTLVDLYPQSGILRALLARSSQVYDQGGFQQKLKSAAIYAPDRAVLYNLINYPEKLVQYTEPVADTFDQEDAPYYDDDYTTYDETENYQEGVVYEDAPINYFHESEEEQQPAVESYESFEPVMPVEEAPTYQDTTSYYTPEPQVQPEPAPVEEEYEYTTPAYQQPETVEEYSAHVYEQPEVIEEYTAPVYQQPEVVVEEYTPPVYEPVVLSKPEPEYYKEPEYLEPIEPEQPEPSSFNNLSYPDVEPEVALPPIPGYHKPSYEEEMIEASVIAASVIDDEVFDEITGIEDIYIEPIAKHRKDIPDVSLLEQQTAPLIDTPEELEDIIAAQYGEEDKKQYVTEELPVSVYTPVEVAEPAPVVPEPEPVEEYSTADIEEDESEDTLPENDEVEFEMVEEPVVQQPYRKPRPTPAAQLSKPVVAVSTQPQFVNDDDARVSKYNDEKMPYSFLWWLDKVRKEHAESHQPYVAFKPIIQEVQRPAVNDELQQQYFENIFHLTSVEQLDIHTRDKRKESEIIDRFIQQDPQLKPPNTEKLDNENKAKRSSEDKDELVSETLARIYLDQMLYPKAIATYQKLLLKFPEKSSYFVAQIKLLEKKIN